MRKTTIGKAVYLISLAVVFLSQPQNAKADFSDSYIIDQAANGFHSGVIQAGTWTLDAGSGRGNLDLTANPNSFTITPNPAFRSGGMGSGLVFSNVAAADGELSFSFGLVTGYHFHRSYAQDETYNQLIQDGPNESDRAGYFVNGDRFYFASGTNSGSIDRVVVHSGDSFGFFASRGYYSYDPNYTTSLAELTISDFTAPDLSLPGSGPSAVPEPSAWALWALGLLAGAIKMGRLGKKLS